MQQPHQQAANTTHTLNETGVNKITKKNNKYTVIKTTYKTKNSMEKLKKKKQH